MQMPMPLYLADKYFIILTILSLLILISSFMLILSVNPIHSLLFLVLIFLLTTCTFLVFKVEFISMLFLVVYLGAIIVLFLFVVMMLNIRVLALNEKAITYFPISFFIFFGFFLELLFTLNNDFIKNTNLLLSKDPRSQEYDKLWELLNCIKKENSPIENEKCFCQWSNSSSWNRHYPEIEDLEQYGFTQHFELMSSLTNLHNIAINLYTDSMHVFILGSLILLVGMLGAIILTLQNLKKIRKQEYYNQNSKNIIKSIKKFK